METVLLIKRRQLPDAQTPPSFRSGFDSKTGMLVSQSLHDLTSAAANSMPPLSMSPLLAMTPLELAVCANEKLTVRVYEDCGP